MRLPLIPWSICGKALEQGASGLSYYCTSTCARSCCTQRASCVDSKPKKKNIKKHYIGPGDLQIKSVRMNTWEPPTNSLGAVFLGSVYCHATFGEPFFYFKSQSIIMFFRSLYPRSVEKRQRRLRLEIEIKWQSKCKRRPFKIALIALFSSSARDEGCATFLRGWKRTKAWHCINSWYQNLLLGCEMTKCSK